MNRILIDIPEYLERCLFSELTKVRRKYILGEYGDSELYGGRMAECLIRIFQSLLGEAITEIGVEINGAEKSKIISRLKTSSTVDEHIRQKVTVLTSLLLDFRNNRDVAHLGNIDANRIDATFVLNICNWIVAELIRVYHKVSIEEAQNIIDGLAIPESPTIVHIEGEPFICNPSLNKREEILVFLLSGKKDIEFLLRKIGYSRKDKLKSALKAMEKDKLIVHKDGYYHILEAGMKIIKSKNLLS